MKALGIRGQLIAMVTTAIVVSMVIASLFIRDLVYDHVIEQKRTTADILTASIVHDIKYEYNYRNRVAIDNIISKYLTYYRIIKDMHYYAVDESMLVDVDRSSITLVDSSGSSLDGNIELAVVKARPSIEIKDNELEEISIRSIAPVLQGSRVIGAIAIDIAIDDVNLVLGDILHQSLKTLSIVVVVAAVLLFSFLQTSLLSRLSRLMKVTQDISDGNYRSKLNDERKDELGQLAGAFDKMTEELFQSKIRIDNHNQIMDQKVKDATGELKQAYDELKDAQSQIVLSEKMASLGVLISGVAHEINTPVGAIANVSRHLDQKIQLVPNLIENFDIPPERFSEVASLVHDVILCSENANGSPSFKETRALENILREAEAPNYRDKARILTSINFTDLDTVKKHLDLICSDSVFVLVETVGYITQSARISKTSAKKIQDIVQALKFYAYTDKDKVEATQINDSIKTSLVLINNRLKHLVEVEADLDESLPEILCTCEIHQIWTVLLNNALDAIDEKGDDYPGKVSITSYRDSECVYVSIKDNGGGIPDSVMTKIFDPFFTTKDIGKGTGLGLSIVSGILSKHGGDIQVATEGNETTFTVSIPFEGISMETIGAVSAIGNK